jgi:hypothetical protein
MPGRECVILAIDLPKTSQATRLPLQKTPNIKVSPHNLGYTFKALIKTQPFVTLDAFLLPPSPRGIDQRFKLHVSATGREATD